MRIRIALALSLVLSFGALRPASADGGAPRLDAASLDRTSLPAGTVLSVSGSMTVDPQAAMRVWTDGTLATDLPTFDYPSDPNVDLVEGTVEHARPGEPLAIRVKVAPALGVDTGSKPFQWYRWAFQLEQIWYFVEFTYVQDGAAGGWQGSWYYCKLALGTACIHGTTPPFPVTFDAATRTFTGKIPFPTLAAVQPDGELAQDTMRPFSTYRPEAGYKYPVLIFTQDRAPAFDPYDLPLESVFLGVAPTGTDPSEVTTPVHASVTTTAGSLSVPFSGAVATDGLAPGAYDLWVKVCFGPCTYSALPFTVTG